MSDAAEGLQQNICANIRNIDVNHPQLVLLYFDEAHDLHDDFKPEAQGDVSVHTRFTMLCYVLDLLREQDMFCVFLSTNPSISRLVPTIDRRPSHPNAATIRLQAPFTELPFGMPNFEVDPKSVTLAEMKMVSFMSKLGRPL
jgi:hypothetical protein